MKKISETQRKALTKIQEELKLEKGFKNGFESFLYHDFKGMENRPDYEELKKHTIEKYNRNKEYYENVYGQWVIKAKEENIVLAIERTSTLKALEKAGYIQIIEEGGTFPDTIKVLIEL